MHTPGISLLMFVRCADDESLVAFRRPRTTCAVMLWGFSEQARTACQICAVSFLSHLHLFPPPLSLFSASDSYNAIRNMLPRVSRVFIPYTSHSTPPTSAHISFNHVMRVSCARVATTCGTQARPSHELKF